MNKEEFSKNINVASMTCLIVLHVQYKTTKFTADDLKKNMNLRRPVWVFGVKTTIAKLFIILPYVNYTNSSKFVKF